MKPEEKKLYRAARNFVAAWDNWQANGGIRRRNHMIKRRWELRHAAKEVA